MSDLISRQAAINEFLHFADEHDGNDGLWHWTGIKAILESLPSAQPEQRWIPCSERLPDTDDVMLVTYLNKRENETVLDLGWHEMENVWYVNGYEHSKERGNEIEAWMPLLEAYEESED